MRYPLNDADRAWAEETYGKLCKKLSAECDRVGGKIPYIARDGVYDEDKADTDIVWWTNGFWPGICGRCTMPQGKKSTKGQPGRWRKSWIKPSISTPASTTT